MNTTLNTLRSQAENNDMDSQYALATAYNTILKGEDNSVALAREWMSAAADNGHPHAAQELEEMNAAPAVTLAAG